MLQLTTEMIDMINTSERVKCTKNVLKRHGKNWRFNMARMCMSPYTKETHAKLRH